MKTEFSDPIKQIFNIDFLATFKLAYVANLLLKDAAMQVQPLHVNGAFQKHSTV